MKCCNLGAECAGRGGFERRGCDARTDRDRRVSLFGAVGAAQKVKLSSSETNFVRGLLFYPVEQPGYMIFKPKTVALPRTRDSPPQFASEPQVSKCGCVAATAGERCAGSGLQRASLYVVRVRPPISTRGSQRRGSSRLVWISKLALKNAT